MFEAVNSDRISGCWERNCGEYHKQLCFVYGWGAVYWSTASRWTQRIKASWCEETELHDLRRSGRPVTATGPDMLNCVAVVIYRGRRTIGPISRGSVNEIFKTLGFPNGCARWVPRYLTTDHRFQQKTNKFCSQLLECFGANGKKFLK